jgi:putative Ca2+/H+ antiporter (TMEM165/GDT1 family)
VAERNALGMVTVVGMIESEMGNPQPSPKALTYVLIIQSHVRIFLAELMQKSQLS